MGQLLFSLEICNPSLFFSTYLTDTPRTKSKCIWVCANFIQYPTKSPVTVSVISRELQFSRIQNHLILNNILAILHHKSESRTRRTWAICSFIVLRKLNGGTVTNRTNCQELHNYTAELHVITDQVLSFRHFSYWPSCSQCPKKGSTF